MTSNYYTNPQAQQAGFIPGMTMNPYWQGGQQPMMQAAAPQYAWNQAPAFATGYPNMMGQPTVFNINGTKVPFGVNNLSAEDAKALKTEKKKPFEIDPIERPISKCTHKYLPDSPKAGQIAGCADENEMFTCEVCGQTFKLLDPTQEEVEATTQYMLDLLNNIKLRWLDVPPQIVEGFYTMEPILKKLDVAWKHAKASWDSATAQGKVFQNSGLNTTNGFGANAYTPIPTQYNQFSPYMNGYVQPTQPVAAMSAGYPYMANPAMQSVNPYSNPMAAQAPTQDAGYGNLANSPLLQNNPMMAQQPQVVPQQTPVAPAPVQAPANPYGMPNPSIPTGAAQTAPPAGSGYVPTTTGTPDPTSMTTTTTAQTV